MKIDDINFQLKDGRQAVLKTPTVEDAEALIEVLTLTAQETKFLRRSLADCVKYTPEYEREFLKNALENEYHALLACSVDGVLVGNCGIEFQSMLKVRHRATVGLAILKDYWGLGIGTKMFEAMENIARSRGYVERLELSFMNGNSRALALYEKVGFILESVKRESFKISENEYLDEYFMYKYL